MIPVRRIGLNWEWELVKWLALMALAAALMCALASQIAFSATPDRAAPAALPAEMDRLAKPMDEASETPPAVPMVAEDRVAKLWTILERHQSGDLEAAATGWKEMELPEETRIWQLIGWGAALLEMGRMEAAAELFNRAWEIDENNALLHYYAGLLFLEEAERAHEWPDTGPQGVRFASLFPKVVPNSRSMFVFAAAVELERAIELAPAMPWDAPLVMEDWPTSLAVEPTVRDLLMALGADRFPAKASHILGRIHLDAGRLEEAERRLDAAAAEGLPLLGAYRELAERYEEMGRPNDARRVLAKDAAPLRPAPDKAPPPEYEPRRRGELL